MIPSVWFLELDLAERRSKFNVTQVLGLIPAAQTALHLDTDDSLPVREPFDMFVVDWTSVSLLSLRAAGRVARSLEDSSRNVDADC